MLTHLAIGAIIKGVMIGSSLYTTVKKTVRGEKISNEIPLLYKDLMVELSKEDD